MTDNKLRNFHLSVLEDFLPVGMAIFNRAKEGGADKVIDGFLSKDRPIDTFKVEGFSSARSLREKLDKISPGLGNPPFEVSVNSEVENIQSNCALLVEILSRIDSRLSLMQTLLDDNKI